MTRCLLLATLALTSLGCGAFDLNQSLPWGSAEKKQESPYVEPETMIVIWNETMFSAPGQRPMRGFGGRVFFYDKNSRPIPVDGEFICYGYNDSQGRNGATPSQPDRKFVFTREQLTHHFGESDIGASYSLFLPWDELGSPHKEISLYPVFRSQSGKLVRAEASQHVLPGKKQLDESERRGFLSSKSRDNWITQDDQGVRQASHVGPEAAANPSNSSRGTTGEQTSSDDRRRTSTFRMPRAMRNAPIGSKRSLTNRAEQVRQVADERIKEYQRQQQEAFQERQKSINDRFGGATGGSTSSGVQPASTQQSIGRHGAMQDNRVRAAAFKSNSGPIQRGVSGVHPRSSSGAPLSSRIANARTRATTPTATLLERNRRLADYQQPAHPAQMTQGGQPTYGHAPNRPYLPESPYGLPSQR